VKVHHVTIMKVPNDTTETAGHQLNAHTASVTLMAQASAPRPSALSQLSVLLMKKPSTKRQPTDAAQ